MDLTVRNSVAVALAVIAVLGYLAGRRSRSQAIREADKARRELRRAKSVAKELEQIAESVRKNLAAHHLSVARFKERVSELSSQDEGQRLARTVQRSRANPQTDAAAGRADCAGIRRNSPADEPSDDVHRSAHRSFDAGQQSPRIGRDAGIDVRA